MRMRTTVAVVLVVLASAVWTAVGQLTPTDAAPRTQSGMIRVAIHPGSCADAAPVPVVDLNSPATSGLPDDAAAPLLSYTEAPVVLADLLADPHALLVTLGSIDAALACGDLVGSDQDNTLGVELREQNDSGLAGVALLAAAGETTRVSIVLAEVPHVAPITTSPTPAGTPAPGAATPIASETPVGIPGIPVAPMTPIPTPTETPPSVGGQDSPYTSEQFGYSVAFDPTWSVVYGPSVDATSDYIVLSNGTSYVDFLGLDEGLTAPECMDRLYEQVVLTRPGLRLVVAHEGRDSGATISTPQQAVEVWDITYIDQSGQSVAATYYANCLVLQPGQSVLLTTHEAPLDTYPAQAALREQLYSGVSLP
jgi:hypothetical protein